MFKETNHVLDDKASLNKIQENAIIQIMFFDHSAFVF